MNTNKSQRDLGNQFELDKLNAAFEERERERDKEELNPMQIDKEKDEININVLPHQRSMEEIIMSMRELFFSVLEMLIDKQNPIPYIFSSDIREFSFALFLIIIGSMLLLFSNVMKNSDIK